MIQHDEAIINEKIVERLRKRIKDGNELCKELFDKGVVHPSMESEIEALEEILGEGYE